MLINESLIGKCSIPVGTNLFAVCINCSPQVFLKSDDLCLMGGEHMRRRPTLPSAHILAMHVQQREIGAFTLTTGACKWTKLRWGNLGCYELFQQNIHNGRFLIPSLPSLGTHFILLEVL